MKIFIIFCLFFIFISPVNAQSETKKSTRFTSTLSEKNFNKKDNPHLEIKTNLSKNIFSRFISLFSPPTDLKTQTKIIVKNNNQQLIDTKAISINSESKNNLSVDIDQNYLKPGKYTVEIIDTKNNEIITQDFVWGVLALNPNKSTYSIGDTAFFAMAVLDEQGSVICDADLTLKIILPDGQREILSTQDNSIEITDQCHSLKVSEIPDYQTSYSINQNGDYRLILTATTKNGSYSIEDSFSSNSDQPFIIERLTATRIYPLNQYPVTLKITANQNFDGNITEIVPSSFQISQSTAEISKDNYKQLLEWKVSLKKNQTIYLKYTYKAPPVSPEFYLLGPIVFNQGQSLLYTEPRSWQIASDTPGETRTKTVQFYIGQNGTAAGIAAGVTWPTTFSIYLPDAISSANTIKSAYIEYSFATATTGAGGTATFGLKLTSQGTFTTQTSVSYTSSGENLTLKGKADFTAKLKADIQSAGTYTYNFYDRLSTVARKADNAKIVITYDYNSAAPTQINTVRLYGGMLSNGTTLAVGITTPFVLAQPSLPENSASIYDAWAEITANIGTTGTTDENIRVKYDSDAYSYYYYDNAGSAGSQVVNLLHRKVITDASHTLSIGATAGYSLTMLGYEQFITYSFNYTNSTTLLKTVDFLIGSNGTKAATTTLTWNKNINIPESSINWKSIYVNGTAHSGADSVSQVAAKIGGTATSFTNSYLYDWSVETYGNYRILSNETNDLNTMSTGNNNVYLVWKRSSGSFTSRSASIILTYSHAKADKTVNSSAKFLVSNGLVYTTGETKPFTVDVSGPTQNISSQLKLDSYINSTTDAVFRISVLPSTTLAYNADASGENMMVSIGHTLTSEVGATGTYTATLDSSVSAAKYADITLNFQYYNPPPAIPSLITPSDTATGISQTPSFVTIASDANNDDLQYEVKICTNSGMTTGCQTFTAANTGWSGADIGTSSFSAGTTATYVLQAGNSLAENTTYYWKTRSIDPDGSNSWSSTQTTPYSFTTVAAPNTAPNTPTLISPSNSATGISISPTLTTVTSDPDSDPLQYKIILATNATFTGTTQVFDQTVSNVGWSAQNVGTSAYSSGTTASYIIQTPLSYSTMYYWKSQAIDYSGTNTWSSLSIGYSFTTAAPPNNPPNQPTNSTPATGTTGVALLPSLTASAFSDSDGGDTHLATQWQVSTDSGFTSVIFDSGTTTATTTITLASALNIGTTYYWHVRYQDNHSAWSNYSSTTHFITNKSPTTPTLILPTDTATNVSLTPTFKTVSTDTDGNSLQYELKICTNSGMTTGCQTFTAANTGWSGADIGTSSFSAGTTATYVLQAGNSLAENTTYYWKTRSIDSTGTNSWSGTQVSPFSFLTLTNPSSLVNSFKLKGLKLKGTLFR